MVTLPGIVGTPRVLGREVPEPQLIIANRQGIDRGEAFSTKVLLTVVFVGPSWKTGSQLSAVNHA